MLERRNVDSNKLMIVLGGFILVVLGLLLILFPEWLGMDKENPLKTVEEITEIPGSTQIGIIPDTGATSQSTTTPSPSPSITTTSTLTVTPTGTTTPTETMFPTYTWIPTATRTPRAPTRIPPTSTPIPNPTINPKLCKANPGHPHYCTPTP